MTEGQQKKYLLLDSWGQSLARAVRISSPQAEKIQMQVLEKREDAVASHEIIQVVDIDGDDLPLRCRLVQRRGDRIVLETLEVLDAKVRQNLRIPVRFETLLYPLRESTWRGRRRVCSVDLSCGGIAFYGEAGLKPDEVMEIVIPITEQPLIVKCKILRVQELHGRTSYAARFIDLCHDEEKTIRRAVFGIQIETMNSQRQKEAAQGGTADL